MTSSAAKTYLKLGVFVLLGIGALVVIALVLGIRVGTETLKYHAYFDESVQGLEVGAPVKYRGVSIGTVAATQIAPDRRHVDVTLALKADDIRRLGLVEPESGHPHQVHFAVPPGLRAQLGSQGLTGVKFVNIDFFDPATNPIEPLPFKPADNTIPTAASLTKSLEDSVMRALDRLPDLLDGTLAALTRIDVVLGDLEQHRIPDAIAHLLGDLDGAATELRTMVQHFDRARIPDKVVKAMDELEQILARLDGDGGLVASTKRATDSVGDLGRRVSGSTVELERTLRDLGEAARSIRDLADDIDRDPDMLVKGKTAPRNR